MSTKHNIFLTWQKSRLSCDLAEVVGRPDWHQAQSLLHQVAVIALPGASCHFCSKYHQHSTLYSPVAVKLVVWIVLASVCGVFFNMNSLMKFHNIPGCAWVCVEA